MAHPRLSPGPVFYGHLNPLGETITDSLSTPADEASERKHLLNSLNGAPLGLKRQVAAAALITHDAFLGSCICHENHLAVHY